MRQARPTPPQLRPTIPTWAVMTDERIDHVQRVAALIAEWAEAMGVPDSERNRWLRAAWLHDALRDAPPEELTRWASTAPGPMALLHGPASAARAKAEGEVDRGVLDAVRYHSVGLAESDMVGRVLYCADFLDPGRSFEPERRAALAQRLPKDLTGVLREIAALRMGHIIRSGWPIPEPTFRFWNSLCAHESRASD
ncbi:MAG: HD domain-containing protein [Gemmatimonadales bacterium]